MADGKVIQGAFGTSYNRSGFGGAAEEGGGGEGEVVSSEEGQGVGPGDAGNPGPGQSSADVVADLEMAMLDARTAVSRLVNVPAPGVIPIETRKALLSSYAEIEQSIRLVVDRLTTSSSLDAERDAQVVRQQAIDLVTAIEDALSKAGVPYQKQRKFNYLLWGGIAVGVAVVGYVGYRAIKHKPILPAGTKRSVRARSVGRAPKQLSGGAGKAARIAGALAGASRARKARAARKASRASRAAPRA